MNGGDPLVAIDADVILDPTAAESSNDMLYLPSQFARTSSRVSRLPVEYTEPGHLYPSPHEMSHQEQIQQQDSDMTSTAGYTLSGNHDRRMHYDQLHQQFEQIQQQQQQQQHHQPPSEPESSPSLDLTNDRIARLCQQGFTHGLAKALVENVSSFDRRIWVVDNSGSMEIEDGHKVVVDEDGRICLQTVSRWEELKDTVLWHAEVAATMGSYTCFRLLNDPDRGLGHGELAVGRVKGGGRNDVEKEFRQVQRTMMKIKPDGGTPLTQHIRNMEAEIRDMLPRLQQSGRRIAVILATDGLPSDAQGYGGDDITQEFIDSLRALEGLPVWMVIRLCTDEEDVIDFYNNLDGLLDFSLEVLDDFMGECDEVQSYNPWLNYALPIHRCRELGYHDRLFDLIDERALNKGELRKFCVLLFGTEFDDIPDPVTEWKDFTAYIEGRLEHEKLQWNPVRKKMKPWINMKKLKKIYGQKTCAIM